MKTSFGRYLLFIRVFCVRVGISSEPLDVWQLRNPLPTANTLNNVRFLNDQFVAVGVSGEVITSADGTVWNRRQPVGEVSFADIAYGGGLYVAIGAATNGPVILTSRDLTVWSTQTASSTNLLNRIVYGNGLFIAVGQRGRISTSSDGTNWIERASGATGPLQSVAFGNGIFIAVGTDQYFASVSSDGVNWSRYNVGIIFMTAVS